MRTWSFRLGFARWSAVAVMPVFIGWILLDVFVHGDPISLSVILGFVVVGMVVAVIDLVARKGLLTQSEVDDGWGKAEQLVSPRRLVRKIYKAHQRTFPLAVCQKGAIGRDITTVRRREGQGRARRRKDGSGKSSSSSGSDSSDGGGDGEPPRSASQHLFLSFSDLAIRWSCSPKTLRNQATIGKLPRPVHLPVGPRFPIAVIQQIESGEWQPAASQRNPNSLQPTRTRGRPRIAKMHGGDQ